MNIDNNSVARYFIEQIGASDYYTMEDISINLGLNEDELQAADGIVTANQFNTLKQMYDLVIHWQFMEKNAGVHEECQ